MELLQWTIHSLFLATKQYFFRLGSFKNWWIGNKISAKLPILIDWELGNSYCLKLHHVTPDYQLTPNLIELLLRFVLIFQFLDYCIYFYIHKTVLFLHCNYQTIFYSSLTALQIMNNYYYFLLLLLMILNILIFFSLLQVSPVILSQKINQ